MPWWAWVWIGCSVLGAATRVALIDRPRKAITRSEAAAGVAFLPLTIWFITWIAGQAQ